MAASSRWVVLQKPVFNGWPLLLLVVVPCSLSILIASAGVDRWDGPGISSMIQYSVRHAIPLLFLVFATSAGQVLFKGPISRWLLRNRKYLGLAFAATMAWQGVFILWLVTAHADYYQREVYVLKEAIEGVLGYLLLAAMTITSFASVRKRMSSRAWRLLHTIGIYFLWAYALSAYWWTVYVYPDPVPLDYMFYWAGVAAWSLRMTAWVRLRLKPVAAGKGLQQQPAARLLPAGALLVAGLLAAGLGKSWYPLSEPVLNGHELTHWLEHYVPYWPFEPFLPLLVIAAGGLLLARGEQAHRA